MFKQIIAASFAAFLLVNACGCIPLLAGAAGGAGTAAWLSGKLTQELNVPYERAIEATRSALKSLRLRIDEETRKDTVTQIMSRYTDGKKIWIDIRRVSESLSRVEVRVGAMGSDEAASKILSRIVKYL